MDALNYYMGSAIKSLNPVNWDSNTAKRVLQASAVTVATLYVFQLIGTVAASQPNVCDSLLGMVTKTPIDLAYMYNCSMSLDQNLKIGKDKGDFVITILEKCGAAAAEIFAYKEEIVNHLIKSSKNCILNEQLNLNELFLKFYGNK